MRRGAHDELTTQRARRGGATVNRHDFARRDGEARLRYLDSDYQVVMPGAYVTCAETGRRIPLPELRYWSVDRQEAYADAAASLKRELSLRRSG